MQHPSGTPPGGQLPPPPPPPPPTNLICVQVLQKRQEYRTPYIRKRDSLGTTLLHLSREHCSEVRAPHAQHLMGVDRLSFHYGQAHEKRTVCVYAGGKRGRGTGAKQINKLNTGRKRCKGIDRGLRKLFSENYAWYSTLDTTNSFLCAPTPTKPKAVSNATPPPIT